MTNPLTQDDIKGLVEKLRAFIPVAKDAVDAVPGMVPGAPFIEVEGHGETHVLTFDMLSQAAQALEDSLWRTEFTMSDFPQPKEREVVREIKGKRHVSMEFVPNWFWVQTKCGQVMQSYVMKKGRLHGLATDEMPVAWMPNPTVLPPVEG